MDMIEGPRRFSHHRFSVITASRGLWALLLPLLILCAPSAKAEAEDRPKVLLLPFQIFAPAEQHAFLGQGLRSMFISRLAGEGLDVLPDTVMEEFLDEADRKGVRSDERARELGARAGAEYAIFGSVTTVGGGYSLDLGILDFKKDPPKLTRVAEAMEENQLIPKLADVAYQFRAIIEGVDPRRYQMALGQSGSLPRGEGTMGLFFQPTDESYGFRPTGYTTLRTGVVSFDSGDMDGDGKPEFAILSRDKLLIAGRDGDTMALKGRLDVTTGEEFLRVSVGDLDRDGRAEIYLVRLYGQRAQSSVFAWDGQFRKLTDHPGHLNVLKDPTLGRTLLLYQSSNLGNAFAGDIYQMEVGSNHKITKGDSIPLETAQLFTLAVADLNRDGTLEFLGLNERNYLHVWSMDGKVLWKGNKELGGSNNAVEIGNVEGQGDLAPRTEINGRVLVADVDNDGNKEVIAVKNIAIMDILERLRVYKTSRLIAYSVDKGTTLSRAWTTREIQYAIEDIQKEGTAIYLAGLKGQLSKMSAEKSRIMWFE
jgi:TolB-like protein